jgi:hypothetical protein
VQALTLTAVRKDDKADLSLRSVYNYGNYGVTAIFNTSDKVNVTATIDKVCMACVGWSDMWVVIGGEDNAPGGLGGTHVDHSLLEAGTYSFDALAGPFQCWCWGFRLVTTHTCDRRAEAQFLQLNSSC